METRLEQLCVLEFQVTDADERTSSICWAPFKRGTLEMPKELKNKKKSVDQFCNLNDQQSQSKVRLSHNMCHKRIYSGNHALP